MTTRVQNYDVQDIPGYLPAIQIIIQNKWFYEINCSLINFTKLNLMI